MDSEPFKPFEWCFWIFKTLGMWQDGNQTWKYFILGFFIHFISIEVQIILQFVYTINALDLFDIVDAFGLLTVFSALCFKCINFFIKIRKIVKLVDMLKTLLDFSADQRHADRMHIRKQVTRIMKVMKIFISSAGIVCTSGIFIPFFTHELPLKIWIPVAIKENEIGFWIVSLFLIYDCVFMCAVQIALDVLPVIFMSFAVGLLNELSARLSEIGKIDAGTEFDGPGNMNKYLRERIKNYKTRKELVKCIEIHQKIKEFVIEIHDCFVISTFIQEFMSSLILCTCAFVLSVVSH
jgi:hypothetical protein